MIAFNLLKFTSLKIFLCYVLLCEELKQFSGIADIGSFKTGKFTYISYSLFSDSMQATSDRFIFSVLPMVKLGNWIPSVLGQWQCVDHLCGLDQVLIQTNFSSIYSL